MSRELRIALFVGTVMGGFGLLLAVGDFLTHQPVSGYILILAPIAMFLLSALAAYLRVKDDNDRLRQLQAAQNGSPAEDDPPPV